MEDIQAENPAEDATQPVDADCGATERRLGHWLKSLAGIATDGYGGSQSSAEYIRRERESWED